MMKPVAIAIAMVLIPITYANATGRNASLINSFQVLCTLGIPDFDRIDQTASAMQLVVDEEIGGPPIGQFGRSKSWFVSLATGPHKLVVSEANGSERHVVSCGIAALDPNGDVFKRELISVLRVGQPESETMLSDGGMRMTVWKDVFGSDTLLRFIEAVPEGSPGIMVFFDTSGPPKP